MPTPNHTLIVGCGLAGPALALLLAQHGLRSTILEARPEHRTIGGPVMLAPNAVRVLDRITRGGRGPTSTQVQKVGTAHDGDGEGASASARTDASQTRFSVYDELKLIGRPFSRIQLYTANRSETAFDRVGAIGMDHPLEDGYGGLMVMRPKIHEVLLGRVEREELITVKMGVKVKEIKEDEEGVTVDFEDGSSARGDILIGADGIHSQIRHYVCPSAPPAEFSGSVFVGSDCPSSVFATLPRDPALTADTDTDSDTDTVTNSVTDNGADADADADTGAKHAPPDNLPQPVFLSTKNGQILGFPMTSHQRDSAGVHHTCWTTGYHTTERTRRSWISYASSDEIVSDVRSKFGSLGCIDTISGIVSSFTPNKEVDKEGELGVKVPNPARVWAPYVLPDLETWHTSRVCILGDAAHAISPSSGQGAAQAFEDVGYMARLLTKDKDIEASRKERGHPSAFSPTSISTEKSSPSPQEATSQYASLFSQFERVRKARLARVRKFSEGSLARTRDDMSSFGWLVRRWSVWGLCRLGGGREGVLRDPVVVPYDVYKEEI